MAPSLYRRVRLAFRQSMKEPQAAPVHQSPSQQLSQHQSLPASQSQLSPAYQPPSRPLFLQMLPVEIRQEIYAHVFRVEGTLMHVRRDAPGIYTKPSDKKLAHTRFIDSPDSIAAVHMEANRTQKSCKQLNPGGCGLLSLVLTCRQMSEEAAAVLYATTNFLFIYPEYFVPFASTVPQLHLQSIRYLRLNWWVLFLPLQYKTCNQGASLLLEKLTGLLGLRITALRSNATDAPPRPDLADEKRLFDLLKTIKGPKDFDVWIDWEPTEEFVRDAPFRLGVAEWNFCRESIRWLDRL